MKLNMKAAVSCVEAFGAIKNVRLTFESERTQLGEGHQAKKRNLLSVLAPSTKIK